MKTRVVLRYARVAPRKVRLVADEIRGKRVAEAIDFLTHVKRRASPVLLKMIHSALRNAGRDRKVDVDRLSIGAVTVDQGPMLKRWMPRAMGRATPIQKKTSHITLMLEEM